MNGLPWYKAYPRDFFEGTVGMDAETKGAYRLVLDLIYMHGGRCPDDAKYVAAMLGMSARKWRAIRAKLIELPNKLKVGGGFISNYRADEETFYLAEWRRKNASSARKRWEKQRVTECERNAIQIQKAQTAQCKNRANVVSLGQRRDMDGEEDAG